MNYSDIFWFLVLSSFPRYSICTQTVTLHRDDAPTPEMVRENGYVCEVHHVTTEDGYILELHRIPGGKTLPLNSSLPPVILQHGLFACSVDYIFLGPTSGLAYVLADMGYDVWLGNARGTTYSKNHTTLNPQSAEFWNFSWHEMGYYDLPAVIDYVLATTGHSKLNYVGHSMGTSMFYVLLSTRPEYNSKVVYMAAMAPIAFMTHVTSPIRYLVPFAKDLQKVLDFFGHGEFISKDSLLMKVLKYECSLSCLDIICENFVFLFCGFDAAEFDVTLLPLIMGHDPAGTSVKTMAHYAQLVKSGNFQQFDYGKEKNLVVYNSTSPPQYNISRISVPMTLIYGENDLLGDPTDVKELFLRLSNPVDLVRVNLSSFNHVDFTIAKHAKTLVYTNITKWLQEHQPPSFPTSLSCVVP